MSEIQPALSPWEWRAKYLTIQAREYDSTRNGAAEIHFGPGSLHLTEHEHPRYGVFDTSEMQVALMALANAALPNDDARKLTREHARLLRVASEAIVGKGLSDDVLHIAKMIEALLPPAAGGGSEAVDP